ncbi:MAG TPA: ABC transporter ATP-binding protein [Candidatus Sulfotelmatobacter sp.]|nr:ABC transporter ATP-binding protein [Candidatus Sulfotelmatobacter sp.]
MALLEVNGLTKRFRGVTALDGVSLQVEAGEAVGIMGPNGAGKTTLYNVVSGFVAADAGSVRLRGEQIAGLSPNRVVAKGLARTFQVPRPFRRLSVAAHLEVVRPAGGAPTDRDRTATEAVLALVGLGGKANEAAGTLSQGELKRLEVARALAARPSLLLLDEPFAGLGPAEIPGLSALLRRLHGEGMTLLIVEHKLRELMALVQRVVVLDYGCVIAQGPPEGVVRDPRVLAAYLGTT